MLVNSRYATLSKNLKSESIHLKFAEIIGAYSVFHIIAYMPGDITKQVHSEN